MAYDADSGKTVMFGGIVGGFPSDATWTWDGSTWTEVHSEVTPDARFDAVMAYDPVRDEIVLAGGSVDEQHGPLQDTWVFKDGQWTQLHPAQVPYTTRVAFAFDPISQRVIVFGAEPAQTWAWDGTNWALLEPADHPRGRRDSSLAYDASRGRLVLFGGFGPTRDRGRDLGDGSEHKRHVGPLDDTWTWDGQSWSLAEPTSAPRARYAAAMSSFGQHVALFGGSHGKQTLGSTWTLQADTWTRVASAHAPNARTGMATAWDAKRHELVLFGGLARDDGILGDTWTLSQ